MRIDLHHARSTIVLVLGALLPSCAADPDPASDADICAPPEQRHVLALPADTDLQFLVDRCRLDRTTCDDLCREVLDRTPNQSVDSCTVTFSDDSVTVRGRVVDYSACDG